ncbi:MAG: thiamine-binding protein [Candidatus Wukongarchaeota archaeon]|nr:thiamine-binding protein [Candidatus Wukongarchaeota archaeon]
MNEQKEAGIMGRVIVEFTVIPLGTGDTSVSKEVEKAVKELAASGVKISDNSLTLLKKIRI